MRALKADDKPDAGLGCLNHPKPHDPHRWASSAFVGAFVLREHPEQSVSKPAERSIQIFDRLPQVGDLGVIHQRLALGRQSSFDDGIQ